VFVLMDEVRAMALAAEDCEVVRDMIEARHSSHCLWYAPGLEQQSLMHRRPWLDCHQCAFSLPNNAKANGAKTCRWFWTSGPGPATSDVAADPGR
jgi:hypothetical protein